MCSMHGSWQIHAVFLLEILERKWPVGTHRLRCEDNIIACRSVARQWRLKKQLYNSRYWVMASPTAMLVWQQLETATDERGFFVRSMLKCYKQDSCESVANRLEPEHSSRRLCFDPSPGNDWWGHGSLRWLITCCSELQSAREFTISL
jgi:hypothetical protein